MHLPSVHLRPATSADCDRLWEWRNDPDTRAASFRTEPVPLEDHRAWFAGTLKNRNRLIYIVEADDTPVGQVRFDRRGDEAEVSISIAADHRGRGLGEAALRQGIEQIRLAWAPKRLVAQIKPCNDRSISAFSAAGALLPARISSSPSGP